MKSVTLQERHISLLTNDNFKDEFTAGIISILRGEEPQASCTYMERVFFNLVHGTMAIPGIPKFDPTGMGNADLGRYNKVQSGKAPSSGLGDTYKDLNFEPIATLKRDYIEELLADCLSRINMKHGSADYRGFLCYLAKVLKHCLDSGEL